MKGVIRLVFIMCLAVSYSHGIFGFETLFKNSKETHNTTQNIASQHKKVFEDVIGIRDNQFKMAEDITTTLQMINDIKVDLAVNMKNLGDATAGINNSTKQMQEFAAGRDLHSNVNETSLMKTFADNYLYICLGLILTLMASLGVNINFGMGRYRVSIENKRCHRVIKKYMEDTGKAMVLDD